MEKENQEKDVEEEEESLNLLWEQCSNLFIESRNGNLESFNKLEELSKNQKNDLIIVSLFLLLMNRSTEFFNQLKYLEIKQQIIDILENST